MENLEMGSVSERGETRRVQRAGKPCHPSNSTSTESKIRENYHPASSTGEQMTEDSRHSSDFPSIIGTCPDMCPARERAQRERLRDLSVFERLNGDPGRTSPSLAVKKFCRTLSTMDVQPSDIRPLPVLLCTLKYLFSLLESSQLPFEVVHDFVFDRTRSIRQDLGMQSIINDQVIGMYEEMVKFHIISNHKLMRCSGGPNISSLRYLNMEQLGEYLTLWFRNLPYTVMNSKEMCFARTLLRCSRIGNYKRFFSTLAAAANYLQFCVIEPFINEVRLMALSYINQGNCKIHPYPLAHLSELLMIEEPELESLCNMCGLQTSKDDAGIKLLCTKLASFCLPRGGFQNYSFAGFERIGREADFKDKWDHPWRLLLMSN